MKKKPVAARVSIERGTCEVYSTHGMTCPLSKQEVPARVQHECEKDGGVTTVRNTPR